MSGVNVWLGGRTILVEVPEETREIVKIDEEGCRAPTGRFSPCCAYLLNDESLYKRLSSMQGFKDLEGPFVNGIYAVTFGSTCRLTDEELIATVRQCANLSRKRRPKIAA